jgi:signal transduction histidine kinase
MVFRDITKEVEVDRIKSEFISNVSHELRTPMTSIKGYADLLMMGAAGEISAPQQQFLRTIKDNADRLSVLVNDLLNISRLDSGSDALELEAVDVRGLLDTVVTATSQQQEHAAKNLNVRIDAAADLPRIQADASKLNQVMTNLIDNAYSYTYAGGNIVIEAVSRDPDHILISVRDSGIGIPEEFRDRVWDRFARNDEHALVMDVAGTGLGLSIVKSLVEMHGGDVWFETETGVGTTFFVLLPVDLYGGKAQP